MIKNLEVLNGTDYEVIVERDEEGDYYVEVRKPAHTGDPYVEYEVVATRFLPGNTTENTLEKTVATIIANDHPSLVGKYASKEVVTNGN